MSENMIRQALEHLDIAGGHLIEASQILERLITGQPIEPPRPAIPYWEEIATAAESVGLDPFVLAGIAKAESAFNPRAVGTSGERGLCQVTIGAWREVMAETFERAFEPALNLLAAGRYFQKYRKWLQAPPYSTQDIRWHLASYNWGPGNVSSALRAGLSFEETPVKVQQHIARYLECIEWARAQGA